jgi:hypothetical protein
MQHEAPGAPEFHWYHEAEGQRVGPKTEAELIALIAARKIGYGTSVWREGFPDWLKIENTSLRAHLEKVAPPPLSGDHMDNSLVWVLAFAPIIGLILEYMLAYFLAGMFDRDDASADLAVENGKYWFITIALNIVLSYFDERRLKKAGHNTDKFKGWVWLVPVYLYQRAQNLNQNLAYFIVWIVCLGLTLLG